MGPKNRRNLGLFAVLLTSLAAVSGCGKASPEAPASGGGSVFGGNTSTYTGIGTSTGTDTGTGVDFEPAFTESLSFTGTESRSIQSVNTDSIYKVQISAGVAGQIAIPGYSNFSASYTCIQYSVTALGVTRTSKILSPNGSYLCPYAPQSDVIDFSDRLSGAHGQVTGVTMKVVGYDFYCIGCLTYPWAYGVPSAAYCTNYCSRLRPMYRTHTAGADIAIQVNGTTL